MDNLTHGLVGALFGQMGLKRRSALAMPTLIIAANLPDIDAPCSLWGIQSLAMRRGLTHGPIALIVLPLVLTAAMVAFDRWQARRGTRPDRRKAVEPAWLLAIAYIGSFSHPALDWLNNYGIRLLEPLSSRWFYGDTLFIIDVWIWAALIAAVWLSLRRERRGARDWTRPAWIGFAAIGGYIFANGLITGHAEKQATVALSDTRGNTPDLVVANPRPVTFWEREVLWRDGSAFGSGQYAVGQPLALSRAEPNLASPELLRRAQAGNADARAFLFWSRMPVVQDSGAVLRLYDQRFGGTPMSSRFSVALPRRDVP